MNQKVQISIFLTILIIFVSIITAKDTHATVRLLDGKLILNGYAKEVAFIRTAYKDRDKKYHDSAVDFLKTSVGIEALYNIKETEDYSLKFFTGMKGWYEASLAIDDPITFVIAIVLAPLALASLRAAKVSRVSPDWLRSITIVFSSINGSEYLNSDAISVSDLIFAIF